MRADEHNPISEEKPSMRQFIVWTSIGLSLFFFSLAAYYWIQAANADEAEEIVKHQTTYRSLFAIIIVILIILFIYQIIPYLMKGRIEIKKEGKS
jgi:Na+-driven multidrug efflux pump